MCSVHPILRLRLSSSCCGKLQGQAKPRSSKAFASLVPAAGAWTGIFNAKNGKNGEKLRSSRRKD